MPHPFIFLFGYVRFRLPESEAAAVVQLLAGEGRAYRNFSFSQGFAYFETSFFSYKRIAALCETHGIHITVESRHGLPQLFWKYRKRYGIFVGCILCMTIMILSNMVIWNVRVVGNKRLDENQVKESLRQCGLDIGDWIWDIDTPVLENRILIESEDIAWISINLKGTVAEVEIRETVPEPIDEEFFSADLVATRDGVIQWLEDARGNILVNVGDTVSEGDVLVSGFYPADDTVGDRYTVAKGKVYARTVREFEVSIPLTYERKRYTGRKKQENMLILFKKEVKFFGNSRNLYANCDTINTVEYIETPNSEPLPFGFRRIEYLEYVTEIAKRSEESAIELALYTLRCKMADEVTDGTLVKKQISGEFADGEYKLYCRAEYIENIAETVERDIE